MRGQQARPPADPVTVLPEPAATAGGSNPEYFLGRPPKNGFKLVETGNISRVGGKHTLASSTGGCNEIGIAWFYLVLPSPGMFYRKELMRGYAGCPRLPRGWVSASVPEQRVADYVAAHTGCSLPTTRRRCSRIPCETNAKDRNSHLVRLRVDIPANATVASASDADLARWLQPVMR